MCAQILKIDSRTRVIPVSRSNLDADFTYSPDGTVDDEAVLAGPPFSLYCLDDARRQAIFVELPPEIDLTQVPFYYQTQYEHALRLFAMPYERLIRLTAGDDALPKEMIFLHSIGRCGSTLLNNVLNGLEAVTCVSEPDYFTQIAELYPLDNSRDAELRALLRACVAACYRAIGSGRAPTLCIKFRAECTSVADLLVAEFPQARHLFLYRNGVDWVRSVIRLIRDGLPPDMSESEVISLMRRIFPPIPRLAALRQFEPATIIETLTLTWASYISYAQNLQNSGLPLFIVRYEDLLADREQVMRAVFTHCGLPVDQLATSLAAFDRDSQAGTLLARAEASQGNIISLSAAEMEQIQSVIQHYPQIGTPHYSIPGTYQVTAG